MKKSILFLSIAASIALSSCSVTRPYEVTNNSLGTKRGESSTITILGGPATTSSIYAGFSSAGIRFNKNYGIQEAAKNGGITKVGSVDLRRTWYILWSKYTLVVTGE